LSRPSPSLLVALLALFVALGGTGYAASKLNGRNLVDRSVAGKKLKRDTITGKQVNEAKLRQVPKAGHADTARHAETANTASIARIASDAISLGGHNGNAFLLRGDKAGNADMLDGLDSTDFLKARGAGPIVLDMPASSGGTSMASLLTSGPLTVFGECANVGGTPTARVAIQHDVELFLFTGETGGKTGVLPVSAGTDPIVEVASTGGLPVWDFERRDFSALSNPASGSAALQGSATAIVDGQNDRCYLAAWAFTS
jgi:hypothetical protein